MAWLELSLIVTAAQQAEVESRARRSRRARGHAARRRGPSDLRTRARRDAALARDRAFGAVRARSRPRRPRPRADRSRARSLAGAGRVPHRRGSGLDTRLDGPVPADALRPAALDLSWNIGRRRTTPTRSSGASIPASRSAPARIRRPRSASNGSMRSTSGLAVIDYGCGSGVLAIAALKLGAAHVVGVDNDPQALAASRDNAERNSVADRLHCNARCVCRRAADALVANISPVRSRARSAIRRMCEAAARSHFRASCAVRNSISSSATRPGSKRSRSTRRETDPDRRPASR